MSQGLDVKGLHGPDKDVEHRATRSALRTPCTFPRRAAESVCAVCWLQVKDGALEQARDALGRVVHALQML